MIPFFNFFFPFLFAQVNYLLCHLWTNIKVQVNTFV